MKAYAGSALVLIVSFIVLANAYPRGKTRHMLCYQIIETKM